MSIRITTKGPEKIYLIIMPHKDQIFKEILGLKRVDPLIRPYCDERILTNDNKKIDLLLTINEQLHIVENLDFDGVFNEFLKGSARRVQKTL